MSAIVIRYDGTDITDDVVLATAKFSALVNGAPGTFSMQVRDDTYTWDFITGKEITLEVDGSLVWGGFLTRAAKTYPLPVQDLAVTPTRYWEMSGVDYNVLFNKRIIFKASDPAGKLDFKYAVGTYDDDIINDLFDNYLDISGDGLDSSGVERVDIVTLDIPGVTSGKGTLMHGYGSVANAGYTWKQAMDVIARATGAIYYIDPDKVFHYVDVDTADASKSLSDTPSGGDEVGYANFRLLYNGTNLVNDMMVWGAALGSNHLVFHRAQDATSLADHGRWQGGLFSGGLFHQASVNLVASSYLNGTPQSKRGGKDDAVSLSCRVFAPDFRVGQKVDTTVDIFGYNDVLPIRRMDVKFINGSEAIFDLTLSHDIDQPWSIFEELLPRLPSISLPRIKPILPVIPVPVVPTPTGGCTDEICGLTDDFQDRTTLSTSHDWGTGVTGAQWSRGSGSNGISYVNSGFGILENGSSSTSESQQWLPGVDGSSSVDFSAKVVAFVSSDSDVIDASFVIGGIRFGWHCNTGSGAPYVFVDDNNGHSATASIDAGFWAGLAGNGVFEVSRVGGSVDLVVYDDASAKPSPQISGLSVSFGGFDDGCYFTSLGTGAVGTQSVFVGSIDIPGINACSVFGFDFFKRTEGSGWGTSSDGHAWTETITGGGSSSVDPGESTNFVNSGVAKSVRQTTTDGGPWTNPAWTMSALVQLIFSTGGGETFIQINNHSDLRVTGLLLDPHDSLFGGAGSGQPTTSFTFTSGTWYRVKMEMQSWVGEAQAWRAKIWVDGSSEPGWMVTNTDASATPMDSTNYLQVIDVNGSSVGAYLAHYQFIDFDYAGKPCRQDCTGDGTPVVFDDGSRAINVSGAWGTPSSSPGFDWVDFGTDLASFGTSGGFLYADLTDGETLNEFYQDAGNEALPWSGEFTLNLDFIHDGMDSETFVEFFPQITDNVTDEYSEVFIYLSNETGDQSQITVDGDKPGNPGFLFLQSANIDTIPGPGDVSHLKWHFHPGVVAEAKFWTEPATEPADWMVSVDASASNGSSLDKRLAIISDANQDIHVDFDNLTFGGGCSDVGPATGLPSTGYVCENPPYTDGTTYQLTNAAVGGSSEVNIQYGGTGDFVLVLPGIARDYTVSNDLGRVVFNDPQSSDDVVRVCYIANGRI